MIRTHHPINNTREGKKKYSKGKNHKTPNRPTDLSNNPTDLIKTKPKNKKPNKIIQHTLPAKHNFTKREKKKKKNP